jgi:uncharacterized protein
MTSSSSKEETATPALAAAPAPLGVILGPGSEPLALGAAVFAIGALTLGMVFVGVFPAGVVGVAIPIVTFTSGLALLITTVWGIILGQTLLAGIFGTVSGLFLTFAAMIIGIVHNWYGIPAADAPKAEAVYFIAFCCYFIFLIVPALRLPRIFPIIVGLVIIGLAMAAASELTGDTGLARVAGGDFLLITLGLFWIWLNVNMAAMGMKHLPALGEPVV